MADPSSHFGVRLEPYSKQIGVSADRFRLWFQRSSPQPRPRTRDHHVFPFLYPWWRLSRRGHPGHWRTSTSDADRNPGFLQVWTECFDAICPWTVGRYGNEEEADRWGQERVKADAEYLTKLEAGGGRKIDYIPVVLPGGSVSLGFIVDDGPLTFS
jgi:hypothetical protein